MKIFKINKKDISTYIKNKIKYQPGLFNVEKQYTGKNVRIAIVGTGLPVYKGFNNLSDFDVIVGNANSPHDELGCTTIVAGFIGANGTRGICGIAQSSELLCLKSFSGYNIENSSIIASVLWAIIKNADIIVLPFVPDMSSQPIYDIIKKAYKNNIFVLTVKMKDSKKYKEIISIKPFVRKKTFRILDCEKDISISLPKERLISSFGEKSFIKTSYNISSLGIVTGLIALLIEKNKKTKNIRKSVKESLETLRLCV